MAWRPQLASWICVFCALVSACSFSQDRCSAVSNQLLVSNLRKAGIIRTDAVENAMRSVDRGNYSFTDPYQDAPQPILHGATISAPHMHAHALEVLAAHLQPGMRALDVGSGSGYLSACMARMVGEEGYVVGIDYVDALVEQSINNVRKADADLLDDGRLLLVTGNGWEGFPDAAPFDCIHVGAAAATMPQALLEQLKPNGRMVIPVGTTMQNFYQVDRLPDGSFEQKALMGVRYVSLVKLRETQL